tara:strand:- start:18030 stop:18698 length:669 start_codon:yes stop_codon:yes gene_type:complete
MSTLGEQLDTTVLKKLVGQRIDQELIYQYGMSLNLSRSDEKIRAQIIDAAQNVILAQAPISDPGDSVLEAFLQQNPTRFSETVSLEFEQYYFGDNQLLAQQALFVVNEGNTIENETELNLPNQFKSESASSVGNKLGSDFANTLVAQEDGWRGVVQSIHGYHVVINLKQSKSKPNLDNNREEILSAWTLENKKAYYNDFLQELRKNSNVEIQGDSYLFLNNQ